MKSLHSLRFGVMAAAALLNSVSFADEAAYTLAYKFTPGQEVHYKVIFRTTITMQLSEHKESTSNESITKNHYRVLSVDAAGNAELEPIIDHVWMKAQFEQNDPVTFDSNSSTPPPPQFEGVQETIGQPLVRLKIAPNGEMVNVSILQQAVADRPGIADLKHNSFVVFPAEAVRIGQSWEDRFEAKVEVSKGLYRSIQMKREYRLERVEGNLATISMRTTNLTPIHEPAIKGQLIQRMPSGTIQFDLERGLVVSRIATVDKSEVNAFGPQSLLHAVSHSEEKLVPKPQTAAKDEPSRN